MKKTKRQPDEVRDIVMSIGPGILQQVFGGMSFIRCIVELIKNARDWGAQLIRIISMSRTDLEMFDNGDGMSAENRDALFSVNKTTARGPRQSGKFCTGFKRMLYSQAVHVYVRTAPKEEPGAVYVFDLSTAEHEERVLSKRPLTPTRLAKDAKSWPFPSEFGTHFVFTLRQPGRKDIKRGASLGRELSRRLMQKFEEIVTVDGEKLPPKEKVGEVFRIVDTHPILGSVGFELYHPKDTTHEELLLTSTEIGEIPMNNLVEALGDLSSRVPAVYLHPQCCGTIVFPRLKEHVNEDRFTVDGSIADDPHSIQFLEVLRKYELEIQRKLQIQIQSGRGNSAEKPDLTSVFDQINKRYGGGRTKPGGSGPGCVISPGQPLPPRPVPPLRLTCGQEFEVGERIEITAHIRSDLNIAVSNLQWNTQSSCATGLRNLPAGIQLTAASVGSAVVAADVPGSPYNETVSYEVVTRRKFRLSVKHSTLPLGGRLPIMGINLDKVRTPLVWTLKGVGRLEEHGGEAMYYADRVGSATVTVKADGQTFDVSIDVAPEERRTLIIRGTEFDIVELNTTGGVLVQILGATPLPRIMFDSGAAGYERAVREGQWVTLIHAGIARAYAEYEVTHSADMAEIDPGDVPLVLRKIAVLAQQVYHEISDRKGP